jgi:hypothetical protein
VISGDPGAGNYGSAALADRRCRDIPLTARGELPQLTAVAGAQEAEPDDGTAAPASARTSTSGEALARSVGSRTRLGPILDTIPRRGGLELDEPQ